MKKNIKRLSKLILSFSLLSIFAISSNNRLDIYGDYNNKTYPKAPIEIDEIAKNDNIENIDNTINIDSINDTNTISTFDIPLEDSDCFVNVYKEEEIYSIDTRLYDKETKLYYHIYNNDGNISKPVIFAFHGCGSSPGCLNNFSIYRWIENKTVEPDTIIVVIEKNNYGSWKPIANEVGTLIDKIIKTHEYTGNIGYIGFSQGVFDANELIISPKENHFTSAMFVDGLPTIEEDCYNLESLYMIGAYYNYDNSVEEINDEIVSYKYFNNENYRYDNIYNVVTSKGAAINAHSFVQAYAISENTEMLYNDSLYYTNGYVNQTNEYGNGLEWLIQHLK